MQVDCEFTFGEKTNIWELSSLSLLELVKSSTICEDIVALLLSKGQQINAVSSAGSGGSLRLEVASSAAKNDIDNGTQWVGVTDLVLSNLCFRVTVDNMGSVT